MDGSICGPPMTLMPTASNLFFSMARMVSPRRSRSTLPSMIWLLPVRSNAADRCNKDSGNRALERDVMVGLISSVFGERVMARSR